PSRLSNPQLSQLCIFAYLSDADAALLEHKLQFWILLAQTFINSPYGFPLSFTPSHTPLQTLTPTFTYYPPNGKKLELKAHLHRPPSSLTWNPLLITAPLPYPN
ncbi:MAG: hypothetical protein EZS28_041221, partial [Streblomastix strix]